jgi:signal transduction histidine kinase
MSIMSVSAARDLSTESSEPKPGLLKRVWRSRPWMAFGFLLTSFAYGLALFVVLVTLISTGVGLAITFLGIPILIGTLFLWVSAAQLERLRIRLFMGETIEAGYKPRPDNRILQQIKVMVKDGAVWKDLAYGFLLFPIGIAEFVIATVLLSFTVGLMAAPLYFKPTGGPTFFGDSTTGSGWQVDTWPEALLLCAIGLSLLIPACVIVVGVARGHVAFARWMLGRSETEELEERVDVLTKTRSDVMEAMVLERRRIERDLHDGAQQRLVSLAMNLGMAKEKMATDPEAAQALVAEAHDEAKQVLSELRELVRGIHPAVLTDRGLDAAISAIAGRSPVPVTVDVALPMQPPEAIESTAYFIVAEALTNIAKYSQAQRARVTIWFEDGVLNVLVWDDGIGGARTQSGSGLDGLADRVAALDGRFAVVSPPSGGTTVRAEIPCALS